MRFAPFWRPRVAACSSGGLEYIVNFSLSPSSVSASDAEAYPLSKMRTISQPSFQRLLVPVGPSSRLLLKQR